jgi:hypothetical protein
MFFKIISKVKDYYALPAVFMIPFKGFSGGYEEYIENKNKNDVTLAHHTFCCLMGVYLGVASGAFLGLTWPISLPIFIGRCLDENNNKK